MIILMAIIINCVRCDHHDVHQHYLCTMWSSWWSLSSFVYNVIIMMIVIIICEQCIHHNSYTIIIIMTIIIICVQCNHHHDYDHYHLYTLAGLVVCPTPHVRRYPWTLTISNNFPLTFPGVDNSTTLLPWLPASPTTWEKSCCKTTTLASYWPWPHQIADNY